MKFEVIVPFKVETEKAGRIELLPGQTIELSPP
jgi:hypothetical protein